LDFQLRLDPGVFKMSDSDKMRAEFEKWASERFLSIERLPSHTTIFDGQYASLDTQEAWTMWQAAYQAGRKVEREAIVHTIRTARGPLLGNQKFPSQR
jgi:hypothetical protein